MKVSSSQFLIHAPRRPAATLTLVHFIALLQVTSYNFATPGFNPNAGHFTQVVWSDSVQVGCGAANCGGAPDCCYDNTIGSLDPI